MHTKGKCKPEDGWKWEWINSNTYGFLLFSEKLIRNSNDESMLIEYAAYRNKVRQQAKNNYLKYTYLVNNWLDIANQQKFIDEYLWASEFRNTRAFGFTK